MTWPLRWSGPANEARAGSGTKADALVSGDKDLLALKQHFAVAILAPDELRLMYSGMTGEET